MKKSRLLSALCTCLLLLVSMSVNATLIDNGGGLIYDTALDITWAQPDAIIRGTSTIQPVTRTWADANTWAAGLMLGGVNGWRLPYISVAAGAGPLSPSIASPVDCSMATELACRDNELGYMLYQNNVNQGHPLFPTLVTTEYWSGTATNTNSAYSFFFLHGIHGIVDKGSDVGTWAVHSGNVSPIPVPAAIWLFGSGLLGLIGISRRKWT